MDAVRVQKAVHVLKQESKQEPKQELKSEAVIEFMASQPFVFYQLNPIADITFSDEALECYVDFRSSDASAIAGSVIRFIPDEHVIRITADNHREPVFIHTLSSPSDISLAELMPGSHITITLIKPEHFFTSDAAGPLCDMMSIIRDSRGAASVAFLADEFVYSTRHITRLFDRYLGYSPKSYCRMTRLHCALREIQKIPVRVILHSLRISITQTRLIFRGTLNIIWELHPASTFTYCACLYTESFRVPASL